MFIHKVITPIGLFVVALFTAEAKAAADVKRGEVITKVRCFICHHHKYEATKPGPTLKAIFNKKPSITNVPFTRWDEASLDKWIENPRKVKINTTMVFPGLPRKQDRLDVVEYLKTL